MEQLNTSVSANELYSDTHDDLAFAIFADSYPGAPSTSEGRMNCCRRSSPNRPALRDRAAFVGHRFLFPDLGTQTRCVRSRSRREANARARAQGLTLPVLRRLRRSQQMNKGQGSKPGRPILAPIIPPIILLSWRTRCCESPGAARWRRDLRRRHLRQRRRLTKRPAQTRHDLPCLGRSIAIPTPSLAVGPDGPSTTTAD